MKHRLRNFFWIAALMLIAGCASGPTHWGQFHGDSLSQGFQPTDSGFALSSAWISRTYKITSSSPVLGYNYEGKEFLYIGTVDAQLVALDTTDGSQRWARDLGNDQAARIVSSPAVSRNRDIYVISNQLSADGLTRSTLHKVDEFSNLQWSYTFPDDGFTFASPKLLDAAGKTLIFVYVSVGGKTNLQGELFVLQDEATGSVLLDRKKMDLCRYDTVGGSEGYDDLLGYLQDTWSLVSNFPVQPVVAGSELPDAFITPTPAIDAGRPKPLIVVADNLCSMGAYEWDGTELSVVWNESHDFEKHSSTALLSNGLMVVGRKDGKVFAHDALTGVKMWHYDAGEPVLATPAGPPGEFIFVVSKNHLQVLHTADGTLVQDGTLQRKLELLDQTFSSPAVSNEMVYVSSGEMLTVDYDLKKRGHDSNFKGNGLSSVAIGRRGDVYAVDVDGTIRKYGGTD
jgi:outer membrane protein assembly factor BamB